MKTGWKQNLFLFILSCGVSFCLLEMIARKYLHVSDEWPNHSFWMKQRWLDNHRPPQSGTTNYIIDQYDSLYGWTTLPNLRNVEMYNGWFVNSNSKGVRGIKEFSPQKTNKLRILTIGDSFTFGECVNDSETFPAILETLLDSAEVINIGMHGSAHDQQLLKLIHEGLQYEPDIVLLGFLNDDISRNELSFRDYAKPYYRIVADSLQLCGVPVPSPDFFINQPYLKSIGLLRCWWIEMNTDYNAGFVPSPVSEKILAEMVKQTVNHKARFMAVYLPGEDECKANKSGPHPLFLQLAQKHHALCIDPTLAMHRFLKREKDPKKHFNCHYTPALNRIIAEEIAKQIKLQKSDPS